MDGNPVVDLLPPTGDLAVQPRVTTPGPNQSTRTKLRQEHGNHQAKNYPARPESNCETLAHQHHGCQPPNRSRNQQPQVDLLTLLGRVGLLGSIRALVVVDRRGESGAVGWAGELGGPGYVGRLRLLRTPWESGALGWIGRLGGPLHAGSDRHAHQVRRPGMGRRTRRARVRRAARRLRRPGAVGTGSCAVGSCGVWGLRRGHGVSGIRISWDLRRGPPGVRRLW